MTAQVSTAERREAAAASLPALARQPVRARSLARRVWATVCLGGLGLALVAAGTSGDPLMRTEGTALVWEFARAAAHPRVDADFLALTGEAALTTLGYAVLGTVLSLVIGLFAGVLGSQIWWHGGTNRRRLLASVGWVGSRVALVIPRSIHEVVWGLVLLSVLGITPLVAVLAIGIPFGAVTAKVFSEILDETDRGPYLALRAAGAGRRTALLYALLPSALSDLISYGFYRFECAIRSAAILGLVGVGGLGFQLKLSFQTLRYEEIWTLLYALIALSAAADLWSSTVRAHREAPRRAASDTEPGANWVLTGSFLLAGMLIPLSAWWIQLDISVLWSDRTWELGAELLAGAWPPRFGPDGVTGLLTMAGATLAMSVIAIAVAFAGGMALAFPAARPPRSDPRSKGARASRVGRLVLVAVTRGVLIVMRAIPPPVWALLVLFVMSPGLHAGALALGVYTVGVLGRLMAEAVENLDQRSLRALRAQGAGGPQILCYGVVPKAMPRFVAYGLYRWEVTIRETVVVGVVGAGGLGVLLNQQLAMFDHSGVVATLLALIALTMLVDFTSAAMRRALR
ncbi:MAG: PhnE/PtxC family ABC transporter permease [Micromonosporaceae bacterium]